MEGTARLVLSNPGTTTAGRRLKFKSTGRGIKEVKVILRRLQRLKVEPENEKSEKMSSSDPHRHHHHEILLPLSLSPLPSSG